MLVTEENAKMIINGLDQIIKLAQETNEQVGVDVKESLDNFICHVVQSGNYRYSQDKDTEDARNSALYDMSRIIMNEEENYPMEKRVQLLTDILQMKRIEVAATCSLI